MMIKPPWTDKQVAALNRWQAAGTVHEFTCPNDHPYRTLQATTQGWVCPSCNYMQAWAHDYMADDEVLQALKGGQ